MDAMSRDGNESDHSYSGYDDDDIIVLGDGKFCKPSKWRMPDVDACPYTPCKMKFHDRASLVEHYRRNHARFFTMCYDCNVPVSIKQFSNHEKTARHRMARSSKKVEEFRNAHFNKEQRRDVARNLFAHYDDQASERADTDKNDFASPSGHASKQPLDVFKLKVFGSTDRYREWKYPMSMHCVVQSCDQKQQFATRDLAVKHYRQCHANYMVWCPMCNRGILTTSYERFYKHHQNCHPEQKLPSNWRKFLPRFKCDECGESFKALREQMIHMDEKHGDDQEIPMDGHRRNGGARSNDAVDRRNDGKDRRNGAPDRRNDDMSRADDAMDRSSYGMNGRNDAMDRRSDALDRRSDAMDRRNGASDRRNDAPDRSEAAMDRPSDAMARRNGAHPANGAVDRPNDGMEPPNGVNDRRNGTMETPKHATERSNGIGKHPNGSMDHSPEAMNQPNGSGDRRQAAMERSNDTMRMKRDSPIRSFGPANGKSELQEQKEMIMLKMPSFSPVNIKPEPKDEVFDAIESNGHGQASADPQPSIAAAHPSIADPMYSNKAFVEAIQEFECVRCKCIFDDEGALHHHMNKKHNMKVAQTCVICKELLRCHSARVHYYTKHRCFVNQCPFCLVCFMDLDSFQVHITNEHLPEILSFDPKANVKMEPMSDDDQNDDGSLKENWNSRYGDHRNGRPKPYKRNHMDTDSNHDYRQWKNAKRNKGGYASMPYIKREIPSPHPNNGYDMMGNRYGNAKHDTNGMYSFGKIKAELLSDNENDVDNARYESSSNEMDHIDFI